MVMGYQCLFQTDFLTSFWVILDKVYLNGEEELADSFLRSHRAYFLCLHMRNLTNWRVLIWQSKEVNEEMKEIYLNFNGC